VRDRLGVKPMYWTVANGTLLFGSELRALMAHPSFVKELDREAVDAVLRASGQSGREAQLRDENHWSSYATKIALLEAAAEVLGDADAGRRIGSAGLDFNLAQGVKLSLRAFGTPRLIYKNIVRATSKFTSTHRMACDEIGAHHARIRYYDVSGYGYHPQDCGLNMGYLSAAPVLFGLPPARISHPVCARDGGDTCIYDVRWETGASRVRKAMGAALGAVAAVGGAGAFAPELLGEATGVGAAAVPFPLPLPFSPKTPRAAAHPRCVSRIWPMFMRDGTPSGFRTTSTGVPSSRNGMSDSGTIFEMTPLLPWRPASLSPSAILRFLAT
jgi:hypothetical protein